MVRRAVSTLVLSLLRPTHRASSNLSDYWCIYWRVFFSHSLLLFLPSPKEGPAAQAPALQHGHVPTLGWTAARAECCVCSSRHLSRRSTRHCGPALPLSPCRTSLSARIGQLGLVARPAFQSADASTAFTDAESRREPCSHSLEAVLQEQNSYPDVEDSGPVLLVSRAEGAVSATGGLLLTPGALPGRASARGSEAYVHSVSA